MHESSMNKMRYCVDKYICKNDFIKVADVGGARINGTYYDLFCDASRFSYTSIDLYDADGVDIVLSDPYRLPFESNEFEVVISGQTFEHCEYFWLLFNEMVRVCKQSGYIFLIAPSAGKIHRYPVDCYRFLPDSYNALAKLANCELIEIQHDTTSKWQDLLGIFKKPPADLAGYRHVE